MENDIKLLISTLEEYASKALNESRGIEISSRLSGYFAGYQKGLEFCVERLKLVVEDDKNENI